jgi:hypothetical protein
MQLTTLISTQYVNSPLPQLLCRDDLSLSLSLSLSLANGLLCIRHV